MLHRLRFEDPEIYLAPGKCDVTGCPHPGRYVLKNLYLCAGCLLDGCVSESIAHGATVYRLPQYHEPHEFAPQPAIQEYTS